MGRGTRSDVRTGWRASGRALAMAICTATLAACGSTNNNPINQPLDALALQGSAAATREAESYYDETVIALSFSGGGMRASAFSHGVLSGLAEASMRGRGGPVSLLERVDIISGVSGGS